jgi:hypothetical protein
MDEIEWMIVGGESGPGHRELDLDWARNMQRECGLSGTAFFFKQDSGHRTEMGIDALGEIYRDYPLAWNRIAHLGKLDQLIERQPAVFDYVYAPRPPRPERTD